MCGNSKLELNRETLTHTYIENNGYISLSKKHIQEEWQKGSEK